MRVLRGGGASGSLDVTADGTGDALPRERRHRIRGPPLWQAELCPLPKVSSPNPRNLGACSLTWPKGLGRCD